MLPLLDPWKISRNIRGITQRNLQGGDPFLPLCPTALWHPACVEYSDRSLGFEGFDQLFLNVAKCRGTCKQHPPIVG